MLKFSIKKLMAFVALTAVVLSVGVPYLPFVQRARRYRFMAGMHGAAERAVAVSVRGGDPARELLTPKELEELRPVMTAYYAAMRRKYERAISTPWVVVPPDPPDPLHMKLKNYTGFYKI